MASFGGRRAPNVSQYVAALNAIPSECDLAAQQDDNYSLADDLATFTNAEFFDFDLGSNVEQPKIEYGPAQEERTRREHATTSKNNADGLGFVTGMLLRSVAPSSTFVR